MRGGLVFIASLILSLAAGLGGYSLYNHWFGSGPESRSASPLADAGQQAVIGSRRPDFSGVDLDGRQRSLSEWDGQVVLVNFWASWCPPCRREIPTLVELHRELAPQGFSVLGAAIDNHEKASAAATQFDIPYPNLYGEQDLNRLSVLLGDYAGSLPYSVLLARDGTIRYTHLGEIHRQTLLDKVMPLLAEPAGPTATR